MAINTSIYLSHSEIKANLSLKTKERYHQPLKNTFRKAKILIASHIPHSSSLVMCVKAINNTLGSNGSLSHALDLEVYPSVHAFEKLGDSKAFFQERFKLSTTNCAETDNLMNLLQVRKDL